MTMAMVTKVAIVAKFDMTKAALAAFLQTCLTPQLDPARPMPASKPHRDS